MSLYAFHPQSSIIALRLSSAGMRFEQWYLQQSARDVNFPAYALFSDEVTFNRDVVCNVHLWSEEIPRPCAVPRGTASLDTKCIISNLKLDIHPKFNTKKRRNLGGTHS
ncbi:hypothetical protein CDAR_581351 [Caerostris darwini]|uniref:Uncharacterized protein n=1 Tax=Caerostris darwini TaxID=1538125 RepID=A0AAV4UW06_9ARAC|nr:hypothetical protein CDAR_581351 [Caerostris darwini]